MALAAVKIFVPGEVLYAADVNALNTNILNNGMALISPLTGNLDAGGYALSNTGSVVFRDAATTPSSVGQLQRNGTTLQYYDGTTVQTLLYGTGASTYNYLFNSSFEIWGSGTSAAPTGWTQSGGTVSRSGAGRFGTYALSLQRVGSDCQVYQDAIAIYPPNGWWGGKTVTLGCAVSATVASRARISVVDSVGAASLSAFHSGSGNYEWLSVTHPVAGGTTYLRAVVRVDNGDTTAVFDGATLVISSSLADHIPSGWQGRKAIMAGGSAITTVPAGSTYYLGTGGTANSDNMVTGIPFKGVARNLSLIASGAPGASQSYSYTLRKGTTDTAMTVTVSAGDRTGSNQTTEVEFAKMQALYVKVVTSAGAAVNPHAWTIECEEIP